MRHWGLHYRGGHPAMPPEYPMPLKTYLQTHFVTKSALAELCEVSVERLDALIAIGAAPQPTYVCGDGLIRSAVFGALPADTGIEGEYFRPEYVRWIQIADSAPFGHEHEALVNALSAEMEAALAEASGDGVSARIKAAEFLPFFFDGTFGLCVADPSSGAGIAKKELLQEQLVEVTGNGSRVADTDDGNRQLLSLIDAYARSSMPFSPAEYPRSSRKRLVDDLRLKVRAASTSRSLPPPTSGM